MSGGAVPAKVGVTGAIGAGKSTWVRSEMARRGWRAEEMRGYRTYWAGERGGSGHLELATWDGRVLWRGKARAEGGRPDDDGLAAAARAALAEGAGKKWLAIDELGMLEAGDGELAAAVDAAVREAEEALVVVQHRAMAAWRGVLTGLEGWREVALRGINDCTRLQSMAIESGETRLIKAEKSSPP